MRALTPVLRRQLETSVLAARRAAEAASEAALESLGVFADRRPEHLGEEQASLRNGLRAKGRQLGRDRDLLVAECAYEQWHRLLFARFLAENGLLLHPRYRAPVTLADCEDLAPELGEPDGWSVAARFAAEILPGIFRLDDPCFRLRLAPEGRQALEEILQGIPAETFAAGDALGWVYQFWQRDMKDEVNESERKIAGADLAPVTQLFTENYMVRFLLENSLGAWWAARRPQSPLVAGFEYLRTGEDGRPAARHFDGWPDSVAEVTVMDPCCGSGHFLVEAFSMLWRMRMEEEGLDPVEAQDAVLRDNLFGLELDPRCVQIAMFAIALQAWKDGGRWRQLPVPNIACSGVTVNASVDEWKALARGDERLEEALSRLHVLFREADTLGSLIDPRQVTATGATDLQRSLEEVEWEELGPLVAASVAREEGDPATEVLGWDAASVARAADYLARTYTLAVTNVPYLTAKRQGVSLRDHIARFFPLGKADLATAFLRRLAQLSTGSYFAVTPENWLSLTSYTKLRERLTATSTIELIARLGPGAFGQISGHVVKPILIGVSHQAPDGNSFLAIDTIEFDGPEAKARAILEQPPVMRSQAEQRRHADCRILLRDLPSFPPISSLAECWAGIQTGDYARFGRCFWEQPLPDPVWSLQQSTVRRTQFYGGREHALRWEGGEGQLERFARENRERLHDSHRRGGGAWGSPGIAVSSMGDLPVSLYTGELFDNNVAVISPRSEDLVAPLWHFCASDEFRSLVRTIDNKMNVTNRTLAKVPFDLERWRRVAEEAGPLPEPSSEDPTQWLFEGRPERSTAPLQVAVARLVGYRWPEQEAGDDLEPFADSDGIVCLPSVAGEAPAASRLESVLAAAFGHTWSPAKTRELLDLAGSRKKSLEDWLRDEFFKQHCTTFGNRPFVWHVWDGRRDGFSALVDYHRLDRKALEKLTYTYLGQDWVERQRAEIAEEVPGAEERLAAALDLQRRLTLVLEGEAPYDVYVRWKRTREQPLGWDPDLNDGVRVNIRPFVEAGLLRSRFNIHWRKDRGKDPDGSDRHNDRRLTLAEKRAARGGGA